MKDKNNSRKGVPSTKARFQKSFHREERHWNVKKLIIPAIGLMLLIGIGYLFAAAL